MKKERNPILLLLDWAGKDKYYLYVSILFSVISGLSTTVPYYAVYRVMESVYDGSFTKMILVKYCLILMVGVIVRFSLFGTSIVLSHKGAYNTLFKVRCMVINHMAKIPLGDLNERNTGEIKTVLNEEIEKLELFLAHHLSELVFYITGPIAIFIYLYTVNWKLALVSLIPLVLAMLIMALMFKGADKMMTRASASIASLNATMIEYVSGMKLIKAYNMGSESFTKYADDVDDEYQIWTEMSRKMGPLYATYVVVVECGLLLIVPIGGLLFLRGTLPASAFILFAFVGSLYLTELRPLQELGSNFAQVLTGVRKVNEILKIPAYEGGSAMPVKYDITLKDVGFSYDGKTTILENCHMTVADGEKIALVGASGSGKSTIIQLMTRFYDVNQGAVLIGGKNVKDIEYEALLQNISIVFQKTFLTKESIFDNICMGKKATLEEVREAAKKAQIDAYIMSLPSQYDTLVGSFGSRFSGGEKQRIALARAILKNAPILILDEATSAVDPENQVEIDRAIYNLCKGKTVIIVAHRLGVVLQCDRVAIVENATISCMGTHEEVKLKNDYYKQAWKDYEEARKTSYSIDGGMYYESK